jgi:hypothetical protein
MILVQEIREALQEMQINEAKEDISKFETLLKKYDFKKVATNKGSDGVNYAKGNYQIGVSEELRVGEHRWGCEYIAKGKKKYLFGGTPLRVLSLYLSGKGAGSQKRSLGDKYEKEVQLKFLNK